VAEITTRREPRARPQELVRLLTFVLSYDDLCAGGTTTIALDDDALPLVLGRGEPAHGLVEDRRLTLDDLWASSRHARIRRQAGYDYLEDQGSKNGTFVNGVKVESQALADGDLVEIGHSLFVYRVVPARLAAAVAQPEEVRSLGPAPTYCPELALIAANLRRIARSRETVLLLGETGVGKEVAARMVHDVSRRTGPFCALDCGAIPDTLFESTLFGHRRGAFTGALDRVGEVVRADGGTLLLDEVGNLSPTAQAKLLRVVEEGQVRPLGAATETPVDVRWLAATNRDLVRDDGFREDLLRRLSGYRADLPPLRARREDLGVLSAHILREAGLERAAITVPAARALFAGALEGNVRQLRAVLRSAALLYQDRPIEIDDLEGLDRIGAPAGAPAIDGMPKRRRLPPRAEVEATLTATGGNVVQSAARLGVHPRQLYRLLKKLAVPLERYRE
jgi:DNA-binding NtrC family response regulator